MSALGRDSLREQGGTPCLMARVKCQVQNNVAVTRFLMKNVLLSAAGAPTELPRLISSPLSFHTHYTLHQEPLHSMECVLLSEDSHLVPYFNFITRKGVLLMMVVQ